MNDETIFCFLEINVGKFNAQTIYYATQKMFAAIYSGKRYLFTSANIIAIRFLTMQKFFLHFIHSHKKEKHAYNQEKLVSILQDQ